MTKGQALSSRERLPLLLFLGTAQMLDNVRDPLCANENSRAYIDARF